MDPGRPRSGFHLQALLRMSDPVAVMLMTISIIIIVRQVCHAEAVVCKGKLEQMPVASGHWTGPGLWQQLDVAGVTCLGQEVLIAACCCQHSHCQNTIR